mmetsp:Transcript_116310/g.260149  ORF Transcript_116310/g.260149 Transcript_116310/m.260149 type:complete len:247 (+) Transcript_116310:1754-2494(+)
MNVLLLKKRCRTSTTRRWPSTATNDVKALGVRRTTSRPCRMLSASSWSSSLCFSAHTSTLGPSASQASSMTGGAPAPSTRRPAEASRQTPRSMGKLATHLQSTVTTPCRKRWRFCLGGPVDRFRSTPQPCSAKVASCSLMATVLVASFVPLRGFLFMSIWTCTRPPASMKRAWFVREAVMFHRNFMVLTCTRIFGFSFTALSTSSMPPRAPMERSTSASRAKLHSAEMVPIIVAIFTRPLWMARSC